MKKLLAVLLAAVMVLGLIACTQTGANTPAPEPTQAAENNEPAGNNEPEKQETKVTDGVWICTADATHFTLLKLKEDGTFYARGLMGQKGYFGKYEIVDMAVDYYSVGDNGVLEQEDQPFDVHTSEKAIRFMHEDGTPYELRSEPESVKIDDVPTPVPPLNEGLGKEYVALADGFVHHIRLDDYTRSLKQNPNYAFSESDEIRNLLYKFMVAEVSEENAAAGWKQNELTLELYHNGYVDMATSDEMIDEPYQKIEGNVFTLANGATVTVDPDAYTAVYEKDGAAINFVKFSEGGEENTAAVKAQYEGEAFGGAVRLIAKLYEDGTITISADKGGNESVIATGTYEGAGLPTITLDKGVAEIKATSATDVRLVYTTDLGDGKETAYELLPVEVSEQAAAPAIVAYYEGEAFGGQVKLAAKMFDDGTIVILGNDKEIATGTYEGAGLPTVTLDKGVAEIKATSATDVKLIYTADLGNGKEDSYELVKVELPAEEAAELYSVKTTINPGIEIEFTLTFFDDSTAVMSASVMGSSIEITADWTLGDDHLIVFENVSNGEFASKLAQPYRITWQGDLSENLKGQEIVFEFEPTDLAQLSK